MKKVFIGVGHGGIDSGAIGNNFKEKDLNLAIATALEYELKRHGVKVKMSRYKDENDSLNEEIKECNEYAPDYAIDIHNNAGGGDGAEIFYHFKGGEGKTFAENILNEITKIGQNSRGVKTRLNDNGTDYYGFIRETKCVANIVECAFVDNATDIKAIDTKEKQFEMGKAIAKGILKTFGIKHIEESESVTRFKDVPETHWAYKAINELSELGLVNGYEDGTFKPDKPVTRAEVATILDRYFGLKN